MGKHGSPWGSLAGGCLLAASPHIEPRASSLCPSGERDGRFPLQMGLGDAKGRRTDSIFKGVQDKRRWSFPIKRISLLKYQRIHTKKRGEKGNYISLRHTFSFKL